MEFFGDRVPYILARNYVLQTCLPIYKALDVDERNLLNSIMRLFENMSFQIGITDREALLTCDNPAILFGNYHSAKLDKVIMPISPNLVLLMGPYENTRKHSYNRLIKLNYEDANTINRNVLKHCKRWIYSKALLTEKQIKWIINERATY